MLEQTAEGIVQSSSLETAILAPGFMPMELTSPRATLSSLLLGKLQGLACLLPWGHLCTSALAFYPISCWVPTWDLEMHKMQCLDLYFTLEAGSGHKVCKWGMVLSFQSSPMEIWLFFLNRDSTAQGWGSAAAGWAAGMGYAICNCDMFWKSNLNLRCLLCVPILRPKLRKSTFGS